MAHFVRRVFYYGKWHLVFALKDHGEPGLAQSPLFYEIEGPADCSYADPFLFERDGKTYLFFEIYSRRSRGVIAYCELLGAGRYTEPKVVLEAAYHLSYPFIFEWNGEVYLIPESQANETIEIYRTVKFPNHWVRHSVLMRGRFADATLHFENDTWWLFAGLRGPEAEGISELHLFMAESPLGPWRSHPLNPVVVGTDCARPAGRLFRDENHLVRPAQDSSRLYGEAIWMNRVEVLAFNEYRESRWLRIGPETLPNSRRTHTINFNEKFQVQDGFRYALRLGASHAVSRVDQFPGIAENQ